MFDLSPRLMHLTSHITHSNGYAPYIAYYRSNGFDQRFRKLKPKPKLNPPNAHRSQIKICENRQTQNVQFRFMPNAFRILKPIQKSSKRVWVFRSTGANAFAKNQMRLAYEDKRDLYCSVCEPSYIMASRCSCINWNVIPNAGQWINVAVSWLFFRASHYNWCHAQDSTNRGWKPKKLEQ